MGQLTVCYRLGIKVFRVSAHAREHRGRQSWLDTQRPGWVGGRSRLAANSSIRYLQETQDVTDPECSITCIEIEQAREIYIMATISTKNTLLSVSGLLMRCNGGVDVARIGADNVNRLHIMRLRVRSIRTCKSMPSARFLVTRTRNHLVHQLWRECSGWAACTGKQRAPWNENSLTMVD